MTDWIELLRAWVLTYGKSKDRRPWLLLKEGRGTSLKRSARIEWDDPDVMGQVVVWETGECELDLGSTSDAMLTLIESRILVIEEDLSNVMRDALDFYRRAVLG